MQASCCDHGFRGLAGHAALSPVRGFSIITSFAQLASRPATAIRSRNRTATSFPVPSRPSSKSSFTAYQRRDFFRHRGFALRPTPPSASEGLEQRDRVREAGRLCLHACEKGLPVRLLRSQHGKVAHPPELLSGEREIETHLRRLFGRHGRLERLGIGLQCVKRVSHILEGTENGAAVLRRRLLEGCLGSSVPVPESAAVEECVEYVAGRAPERISVG